MENNEKKQLKKKEAQYYEPIRVALEKLFKEKFGNCKLELTSKGKFSNEFKKKLPNGREIIFSFLKTSNPDLAGYVDETTNGFKNSYFIVVEIKDEEISLEHIYQIRRYAELFDAKFAFLVSTKEIPEEIKRLSKVVYKLLQGCLGYEKVVLVHFNSETNQFLEWFEKNPFEGS